MEAYAITVNDPDEGPVFWLALAATQWKTGRLEDAVKAKALDIIDNDVGLHVREEAGAAQLRKRKAVLRTLREQLTSPQPPRRRCANLGNAPHPRHYPSAGRQEIGQQICVS